MVVELFYSSFNYPLLHYVSWGRACPLKWRICWLLCRCLNAETKRWPQLTGLNSAHLGDSIMLGDNSGSHEKCCHFSASGGGRTASCKLSQAADLRSFTLNVPGLHRPHDGDTREAAFGLYLHNLARVSLNSELIASREPARPGPHRPTAQ